MLRKQKGKKWQQKIRAIQNLMRHFRPHLHLEPDAIPQNVFLTNLHTKSLFFPSQNDYEISHTILKLALV